MTIKKKILAYLRVSTDKQDVKNQELEIRRYCADNNLSLTKDDWISVVVGSRKDPIERRIEEVISKLKSDSYTTLIVTELSRLSRTIGELLYLLEKIEKELNIEVIATKDAELNNLPEEFKLMRRIFAGYFAQEERRIISLRTKEALASKKEKGEILGKRKGTLQKSIYDPKLDEIKLLLSKNIPLTTIVKIIGIGRHLSLSTYLRKRKLMSETK